MKTITVDNKDYKLEFTFDAAECRDLIQKMFNLRSGAYIVKNAKASDLENGNYENVATVGSIIDGTSEMAAEIPHVCIIAFYAGLLENNPLSKEDAKALMKAYMKENKLSFRALYDELNEIMESDGFFDLSGLTEMLRQMNSEEEEETSENKEKKNSQKK